MIYDATDICITFRQCEIIYHIIAILWLFLNMHSYKIVTLSS